MKLFFRSALCTLFAALLSALSCSLLPEAAASAGPIEENTIFLLAGDGSIRELAMEDYLLGVLAGEMPASFPEEALKAQAVASRSYALRCAQRGKHGANTLCAASGCCQCSLSQEACREKWGADYALYAQKLRDCIQATEGEVLFYGDEPAESCFHASSSGCTESSEALWGSAVPYLVSVSTPESQDSVPRLTTAAAFTPEELAAALAVLPQGDASLWLGETRRDEAGRVESMEIGGRVFSGVELRSLLGLRSTDFEAEFQEGSFHFTVSGSGHGVGMSQYGARIMAEGGMSYREILAHYYPGTVLS